MSLPACQERALGTIENALEASEPRMKAMFAMFARLTKGEQLGGPETLPNRRRPWWRSSTTMHLVFPVAATMVLIAALVIGLTMSKSTACGMASSGVTSRSSLSCTTGVAHPAAHPDAPRPGSAGQAG
jgi:hypothetical protein